MASIQAVGQVNKVNVHHDVLTKLFILDQLCFNRQTSSDKTSVISTSAIQGYVEQLKLQ